MKKIALILWSIVPKKVGQSNIVGVDSRLVIEFVWLGKKFKVSINNK